MLAPPPLLSPPRHRPPPLLSVLARAPSIKVRERACIRHRSRGGPQTAAGGAPVQPSSFSSFDAEAGQGADAPRSIPRGLGFLAPPLNRSPSGRAVGATRCL
jgi:hypothetical protein